MSNAVLWINRPSWLSFANQWPTNVDIGPSPESSAEANEQKKVLAMALPKKDEFTQLMEKYNLKRTLRICAWLTRFYFNCRSPKTSRVKGPLSTDEIKNQEVWWTERAQTEATCSKNFQADKLQLSLQPDASGILECRGRIVVTYPIYLPDDNFFAHKFVQQAHLATLQGGVTLTMAKVRGTHSPLKKASEESHPELLGLEEVPSSGLPVISARSATHYPDPRSDAL